jgi:hypothetical protein
MSEDWIQKLADEQRHQEEEQAKAESAKNASRKAFDALAAPFYIAAQEELRRLVTAYNKAIGRDDLVIAEGAAHVGRAGTFEIHRGSWIDAHCNVDLYNYRRQVTVEYSYTDGQGGRKGEMKIDLIQDENGIRAQTPPRIHIGVKLGGMPPPVAAPPIDASDGSAAAVAKQILTEWVAHFPKLPPQRR